MYVYPNDNNNNNGFLYTVSTDVYSNDVFIFEYIKSIVVPFLFPKGMNHFDRVITNFTKASLIANDLSNNPYDNDELPVNDKLLSIMVTEDYSYSDSNTLSSIEYGNRFFDISEYHKIMRDNLFILAYSGNISKYNVTLTVKNMSNKLYIKSLLDYMRAKFFMNKYFSIKSNHHIKFIIDDKLIKFIKLLYGDITDEDLSSRLVKLTNGNIFEEIDKTTGNKKYYSSINTYPLMNINSLDLLQDDNTASITFTLTLFTPTQIFIDSEITIESLPYLNIRPEVIQLSNILDTLGEDDTIKALNFDINFIKNNRDYYNFTDEDILNMEKGILKPYVDITNLTEEEIKYIGIYNANVSYIENMKIRIEGLLNDNIIANSKNSEVTKTVNNNDYDKIKQIILIPYYTNESPNKLNIGDDLVVYNYITNRDNIILEIYSNNVLLKENDDYKLVLRDDNTLDIEFRNIDKLYGSIISLSLYKKKD